MIFSTLVTAALLSAQADLGLEVDISRIVIRQSPDRFPCAGRMALGCFRVARATLPSGEVREYGIFTYSFGDTRSIGSHGTLREIVAHESVHAVRWLAGDPDWTRHDDATAGKRR